MKRILLVLTSAALTFTLNAQTNLAPYGDFEVGEMSEISGWWTTDNSGKALYMLTDTPENVFAGKKALHVLVGEKGANAWDIQRVAENLPLEEGAYGRFSIVVKGTAGTKMNFHLQVNDVDWLAKFGVTLTTTWKKYSYVTYHETADPVRIALHFAENGDYYIDNIELINSPIVGAEVVPTGDTVLVEAGWNLKPIDAAFEGSYFKVYVNGVSNPVTKVANFSTKKIALLLTNKIIPTDSVTVSYNGLGSILYTSASGIPDDGLISFSDEAVWNKAKAGAAVNNLVSNRKIEIFPNPAEKEINILNAENIYKVSISNLAGQLVYSNNSNKNKLNISNLNKGIYLLNVQTSAGSQVLTLIKK